MAPARKKRGRRSWGAHVALERLRELGRAIERATPDDDDALEQLAELLLPITVAIDLADVRALQDLRRRAARHLWSTSAAEACAPGSTPTEVRSVRIATYDDEAAHLVRLATEGIRLGRHRHRAGRRLEPAHEVVAWWVEHVLFVGLQARCEKIWKKVPSRAEPRSRQRLLKDETRERARERIAAFLKHEVQPHLWTDSATAEAITREFLGAIGISSKDRENILRSRPARQSSRKKS